MKISLISTESAESVWQNSFEKLSDADVVVFGFNGLGLVSYKCELSGETEYFSDIARLSKQLAGVVISGCDTETFGVFRHSVVIADKGKIIGVADMLSSIDDSEFMPGSGNQIYQTSKGKIGVLICEDLFFFDRAKELSSLGADLIVCVFQKAENYLPIICARALAYTYGVCVVFVSNRINAVCKSRGDVVAKNGDIECAPVNIEKDYRKVTVKKRGLYRD